MNELFTGFPMVQCPHCKKESQWDDYYDLKAGEERECEKCGKTIHVHSVDYVMYATVSTEKEA